MRGIRVSARAVVLRCSPPFTTYEGTDGDGDTNVYRACVGDTAGDATQITNYNDGGATVDETHNPVLSPDGTKILFEAGSASTGFKEIWVVSRVPGSTPTQLVADGSNHVIHPSWGPDSDTFVYVRGAGGAISGGSIEKDTASSPGSPATLKSAGGGKSPFRPAFNFDGTRVAYLFDTDIGGTGELRVMDDDGTNDAALDTAVKYRFTGPQFSWATTQNLIAYDDGATPSTSSVPWVIADDGTGKTQLNTAGDATGVSCLVSDRAWPVGDGYIVMAATLGLGSYHSPVRAELDGSDTTTLISTNGSQLQDYFRQVLVASNRIWFIESAQKIGSCALDGTGYRVDLLIDGAALDDFGSGQGWFYN